MPSVEFMLARLTAKSAGLEPRVPGDANALTVADVAMGAATVANRTAYHAIMAKYCQDERSVNETITNATRYAWALWFENEHKDQTKICTQRKLAELAVLYYLVPYHYQTQSNASRASFCDMSRKTWERNYSQHFKGVTGWLFSIESDALAQIQKSLR